MFSTSFKKIGFSFVKNILFEKSKMAAKIADIRCETAVAIATVLN